MPLSEMGSTAAFILGYPDNTFRGSNRISREEFINILFRLRNPVTRPQADANNPSFNDVASARWSYDAIEWAIDAGIIVVGTDGNFNPRNELTRAELAEMLVRAEGWTEMAGNTFRDVVDHPQQEFILKAVRAGIFLGYPDGTFRPENTATRYELVAALVRYIIGHEPEYEMWGDIEVAFADTSPQHWAFKYIALATTGF